MVGEYENICIWPNGQTCRIEDLDCMECEGNDYIVIDIQPYNGQSDEDIIQEALKAYRSHV